MQVLQIKMFVTCLAISIVFPIYIEANGQQKIINMGHDNPTIVKVQPLESLVIHPINPTSAAYIVCQVHAQSAEITLSSKAQLDYSSSKHGRDVGIVSMTDSQMLWYVFPNSTTEIKVLVHLTYYTGIDPLPGGCNEEYNLENDPNINLLLTETKAIVDFQWSNTGWKSDSPGTFPDCSNTKYWPYLSYHGYVNYIQGGDFSEETYFEKITQMLTAERTKKHGTELKTLVNNKVDVSSLEVASYRQQGVVYMVVVTYNNPTEKVTSQAAYIPVVTYACEIGNTCKDKDAAAIILTTVAAIVGAFICFVGHRYFKTQNFVFGFLVFSLVFYQILSLETEMSEAGVIALAFIFGLIGGCLLLGAWWYFGMPVLNVIFIALVGGYLVSSILFYTPFGNLSAWDSHFNYGSTFTCGVLIVPVMLLLFTKTLNILTCAFVGSYGIVVALDTYIHGGMRNIILNSLRHGTDTSYIKVVVTGPFTVNEIALTCVWIIIFACGTTFQVYREWKKAPFPPCPRQDRRRSADLRRLLSAGRDPVSSDREPLLRGDNQRHAIGRRGHQRQYGAIVNGEHSESSRTNSPND